MAVNNRVLPRPYFFDDPEGSDEDIPAPWANSSNSNIRYNHTSHSVHHLEADHWVSRV